MATGIANAPPRPAMKSRRFIRSPRRRGRVASAGRNDLLPAVLADLLRRQVSLIVVAGNSQIAAAKAATTTVPIVFLTGEDPVKIGFVASLNRPGGNLTGVNTLALAVGPKRLEVMHELLPTATRIALLANPSNPISTENQTRELQAAARPHAIQLDVLLASSDREFDAVFASLLERRTDELIILPDAFLNSRSEQLAHLALRHRVPAIFQGHQFVMAGGLMSYGTNSSEAFRLVGVYAGRVLKGEKPPRCRSFRAPRLNCSSISRPPRPSGSVYHCRFSAVPTR